MAEVITRFKLETTQYDSKLRDAAKGLTEFTHQASLAGNEFAKFTQKNVDAARAFGNISTSATNAKDKVKELVGAYNDVAKAYNALTKEQQQSDFGKAMAESMQTLQGRIKEAKQEMNDTGGILGQLKDKFTVNIDALKLFQFGLTAAKGALEVAKDAFFNNEQMLDEWGRTVESCESLYKGFLNSLNTGDISGFLNNIDTITKAARDAYDALDELATFNAFNKANIAGARADLSGSIADFREGKGGKDAVTAASEALIKELQTKQKLQKEAYEKVVASVARDRSVNPQDLLKVMTGSWGSFKELKELEYTGKKSRIVATGGTFTSGPTYQTVTEAVPANERERLAQAVKHLNDTEIDNFQSLAEAAKMTEVEINNQRKMVARVLNSKQGGSGGGGHGGSTTTATHKVTKQEQAANKIEEAERTYAETLQKAAIRMEVGLDSTLDYKKKELSAQERLFDAYNDAYATYADPKYKEAASEAAGKIKTMAGELKSMTDTQEAVKKAARELEAAQKKLTDAETKLAEAQATGSATAIYQAQQAVNKQRGVLDRMKNGTPAPTTTTGFEAMKQTITAEVKLERMQVDETTLHTILKDAVQHSINGMDLQLSGLSDQIAKGIDIPDKKWQEIIDEYNKIRQQIGEKPIEVDLKTGQLAKDGDAATKSWRTAASAINSASGAISNIEDPGAKILSTIGQAIATVALAYSESLAQTKEKKNIWAFIAAAAAATISMVSTISQIHSSTGYAEGGIVKGNTYSGDMIQANDGTIGLNAGEVVLNKAQQGVLASQLQGAGGNINLRGIIRGEDILVVADRSARRQGKGELLFWK